MTKPTWKQETTTLFRLVGTVVVTLEAGSMGLLCARSPLGNLIAMGTWSEFQEIAKSAKATLVDHCDNAKPARNRNLAA